MNVRRIIACGIAGGAIAAGAWFEASLLATLLWRRRPALRGSGIVRAGLTFGVGALLAGLAAAVVAYGVGLLLGYIAAERVTCF